MVHHVWSDVTQVKKRPEPPCESLRELERHLMEWLGARKFYADKGISHKIGVLLHGPPGTGKTQFVERIAAIVWSETRTGMVNPYLIRTATAGSQGLPAFTSSTASPTSIHYTTTWNVSVCEDFDRHYHGDTGVKEDSPPFSEVLKMLDERLGITFITVNDVTKLDPAVAEVRSDGTISRPGRIDYVVYVGIADERGRRACAEDLLSEWPELVDQTVAAGEGETIAQFQNRCKKLAVARYWKDRKGSGSG